jgi:hypothetical protein
MAQPSGAYLPPITPDMRDSARANPNSWLFVIDPAVDPTDDVPQSAIVGAYPVNAAGEIEEHRYAENDTYLPSPRALGWPEPTTPLERIIQLAKAGHRPARDLPAAVLDATLLVYAPADLTTGAIPQWGLTGVPDPQTGRLVVPACTSAEHVPPHWPAWWPMRGSEVVPLLAGQPLAINPDGPVSAIIPAELLAESVHTRNKAAN